MEGGGQQHSRAEREGHRARLDEKVVVGRRHVVVDQAAKRRNEALTGHMTCSQRMLYSLTTASFVVHTS